ncbi:MAG: hypothetical protein FJ315_09085 [SAR202 cluster bacterium]|nr:hypothetical protein [SAR202 cluster bacterium]
MFRHLNNGFRGWDCRWDELAKSYCYYADGKNLDRYRQVILDAIADVEARKPAGASKGGRNVEDKML